MYRVTLNGTIFSTPEAEETALISPVLTLEANKAGSFTFTMAPDHPFYSSIVFRQSIIDVYQDSDLIFEGIPVTEKTSFDKLKTIECEGEMTFFNDTIQRQHKYTGETVQTLITALLSTHNAECDAGKTFTLGTCTVSASGIGAVTNYETTMNALSKNLVENFGGYLSIRHNGGVRYLDYTSGHLRTSSQIIKIGQNLLDLTRNTTSADIATVVIPLGAKQATQDVEGLEKRLDIKSVNANKDYVIGTAAATYGYVWKTVTFDNIDTAAALKTAGENYLTDAQWANVVIEATAFDLGIARSDVEQFRILDKIRVVSAPHDLDRYFLLTKLELDLNEPGNSTIQLGENQTLSLSAKSASNTIQLKNTETDIQIIASDNARELLESATGGNVYFRYNGNGVLYEIDIMDTNDPNTATNIWRWNINGLGYTSDGGLTYDLAMTMNGEIDANFIKVGTLSAIEMNNGTGTFRVLSDGTVTAKKGTIGGFTITDNYFYNYDSVNDYLLGMNNVSANTNWLAIGKPNNGGNPTGAWSNCAFRVTKDGKVYATDAHLSGNCDVAGGVISGAITAATIAAGKVTNTGGTSFIDLSTSGRMKFVLQSTWYVIVSVNLLSCQATNTSLGTVYGYIYVRNGSTYYLYSTVGLVQVNTQL